MTDLPDARRHEILLDVFCCVMVGDGKASRAEKEQITSLLLKAGSQWSPEEVARRIDGFADRVRTMGFRLVLNRACNDLRQLSNTDSEAVLEDCLTVASTDSIIHPNEKKVIARIRSALRPVQESAPPEVPQFSDPDWPVLVTPTQAWARLIAVTLLSVGWIPFYVSRYGTTWNWRLDWGQNLIGLLIGAMVGVLAVLLLILVGESILGVTVILAKEVKRWRRAANPHVARMARQSVRRWLLVILIPWGLSAAGYGVATFILQWPWLWSIPTALLFLGVGAVLGTRIQVEQFEVFVFSRHDFIKCVPVEDGDPIIINMMHLVTDVGVATCNADKFDARANSRYWVRGRRRWTAGAERIDVISLKYVDPAVVGDEPGIACDEKSKVQMLPVSQQFATSRHYHRLAIGLPLIAVAFIATDIYLRIGGPFVMIPSAVGIFFLPVAFSFSQLRKL